jgi:hypothetical protein
VDDLAGAIERLWNDEAMRERLGANAREYATKYCSDEAAGVALKRVLDEVAGVGPTGTKQPNGTPSAVAA